MSANDAEIIRQLEMLMAFNLLNTGRVAAIARRLLSLLQSQPSTVGYEDFVREMIQADERALRQAANLSPAAAAALQRLLDEAIWRKLRTQTPGDQT